MIFLTCSLILFASLVVNFLPKAAFPERETELHFFNLYQLGYAHKFSDMRSTCGPECDLALFSRSLLTTSFCIT